MQISSHFNQRLLILFFSFAKLGASAAVIYVAPNGNDQWSGTLSHPNAKHTDGPLASLIGARDMLRKHSPPAEPVTILIANGTYNMTEPLVLTPADSGTTACPIRYQAALNARPIFTGGRLLAGWRPEGNGLWSVDIPEVSAERWYFEQLWVNDHRAIRARYPNRGYLAIDSVREEALKPDEAMALKVPPDWTRQIIQLKPTDLAPLEQLTSEQMAAVQFAAPQNWQFTRRYLKGIKLKAGLLTLTAPRMHLESPLKAGGRYYLENAKSLLDAPGEWFLDRRGKLYYRPRKDEDMPRARVVAPALQSFVIFQGDPANSRFVEHITFSGLTFHHSQWLTPPNGVDPSQAAQAIEAVIMADGARHITLDNCEIAHIGKYAIWFRRGCSAITVQHCHLYDLGAGGARIGDMMIPAHPTDLTTDVTIDNNIIHEGGRLFPEAVGIWVGQSGNNRITHNDISDFFYSGISVGWQWDYLTNPAVNNEINFNRIHHLGWGLLSDMGGIYTLGVSTNTKCICNVIHDIFAADYGGWGIYLDGASSEIVVKNNLVYTTMSGGFHQHYGRENIIQNNIFANGRDAQLQLTRIEPHHSLTFSHNIVYWATGNLFTDNWRDANVEMDNNLYFQTTGATVFFNNLPFAAWQASGRDQRSLMADPLFKNPRKDDFRLRENSPALKLGYHLVDFSQAGVYGTKSWQLLAEKFADPRPPGL